MKTLNPYLRPTAKAAITAALREHGRVRLALKEVIDIAAREAGVPSHQASRQHLKELLDELADAEVLLPIRAAGRDAAEFPPLPARFRRPPRGKGPGPGRTALHPLLPSPPRNWWGTEDLGRLDRWVREHATRPPEREPIGHRMLEIFGKEKPRVGCRHLSAFPDWLGERASLLNLARYEHPAGSWMTGEKGGTVLMVENAETYSAICEVLRATPCPALREVVFGGGNALARPSSATFTSLVYFGDWDPDGVAALLRLMSEEARAKPWTAAYEELLAHPAVPGHSPRSRALPRPDDRLPSRLHRPLAELELEPRLIPQEWIGLRHLRRLLATFGE